MLKNQQIIEKLSMEEKLSLLTEIGALEGKSFGELDRFGRSSMAQVNTQTDGIKYPAFENLANSWNPQLLSNVAEALALRAKENGIALLHTPSANVMPTPYSFGLSEDPCVCGTLVGATIGGAGSRGVKAVVGEPSLSPLDVQYSDKELNERAIGEYFKKSFKNTYLGAAATYVSKKKLRGEYKDVNEQWQEEVGQKHVTLVDCHTPQEQMELMQREEKFACGEAYYTLLSSAEKYQELRKAFENGNVSLTELESACKGGSALSPDDIDSAVDKALEFLIECQSLPTSRKGPINEEKLALQAAEESIVLLKNEDGVLPIRQNRRIVIIGDDEGLCGNSEVERITDCANDWKQKGNLIFNGKARGYVYGEDRSDKYIAEAVALAQKADVAVVLLGHDEKGWEKAKRNRTTKLPANQLALLDALSKTQANVVAVVCGNGYPDMRFDKKCKAVLFASAQSTFSAKALLNVLTGRANPSGKLACTCYDNTDEYFRTLRAYKDAGRNKVGTFYGYRHYDISGIKVKYPFGHGLSYSRFTCTSLQILGDVMNIAVKNVGYRAGAEVIQIYVGKDDSSIVRPKKELKTFFKVYLNPGQTQMLTIRLSDLDLTVWDKSKKRMVSELGSYEYYIGTSLSNVLQKGKFVAGKEVVEADQERYADYLQSFSNVKRGGFYLEEPIPEKKRSAGLKKAGLIWFFSMVCLDIFFAYFSFVRWIPGHWIINLVVFGLTLTPLIMAISGHAKIKKKIRKEQDISMKKKLKKREALNINDLADEIPYELLFEQEFSAPALEKEEKALVEKEEEDTAFLRHVPFDKEFTCAKIKDDFTTFAYERGITLDEESVRKLFSAFAASRLVILQCDDEERQATLLSVLGEYFATPISLDAVSGEGEDYDVRYKKTSDGEFALTNIAKGIIGKVAEENKIFTIAITNVQASSVKSALAPFVRFIDQPHKKAKILIRKNENSYEEGHDIPETTWIVLAMAGGEKFVDLPKYVLDMASIVPVRLQDGKKKKTTIGVKKKTEEVQIPVAQEQATDEDKTVEQAPQIELEETVVEEEKTLVKQLLYSQWNKLVEYACRDYQLDEALWKRVDRLKEYVNGYCAYTVENKQWQRMEKFVATYMAMGGNAENALDNVLAQLLINGVISALVESNKKLDEKFSHTLENIFGTGSVSVCLKALRDSGKNI